MTRRDRLIILAAGGSAALLLAAFFFQYMGGLEPCRMCIWQRWPHAVAVVIGALALGAPRIMAVFGSLAAATSGGIGVYHTGVERGWWEGPSSCTGTGNGLSGLSGAELLSTDAVKPVVMCDAVTWELMGLSMASWNALISFGLAAIWIIAVWPRRYWRAQDRAA